MDFEIVSKESVPESKRGVVRSKYSAIIESVLKNPDDAVKISVDPEEASIIRQGIKNVAYSKKMKVGTKIEQGTIWIWLTEAPPGHVAWLRDEVNQQPPKKKKIKRN